MPIAIVTDSGCDLPAELCTKMGIEVVPLKIRFGTDELIDRVELDNTEFWARCAASASLPETSAPSPGDFEAAYRAALDKGADGIVTITLSSKMSATGQAAILGANAFGTDLAFRHVDSLNASMGEGLTAFAAAELAAGGADIDAVASLAERLAPRTHLLAALDTLDNLRKGGRIGGAQAMLGSLLSIKPLITVRDGEVHELGKQRTRAKSLAAVVDKLTQLGTIERLGVMHAQAPDLDAFLERLNAVMPNTEIVVGEVGPVIGTHVGPACMGVVAHTAA